MSSTTAPVSTRQQQLIRELVAELATDFPTRHAQLQSIRIAVKNAIAASLQQPFNDYLVTQPQETLIERQQLAAKANNWLRHLSLAIKCPKTGLPAILLVDTAFADHHGPVRFRLQVTDEANRPRRTVTSTILPWPLEIVPAPDRREGRARSYISRGSSQE